MNIKISDRQQQINLGACKRHSGRVIDRASPIWNASEQARLVGQSFLGCMDQKDHLLRPYWLTILELKIKNPKQRLQVLRQLRLQDGHAEPILKSRGLPNSAILAQRLWFGYRLPNGLLVLGLNQQESHQTHLEETDTVKTDLEKATAPREKCFQPCPLLLCTCAGLHHLSNLLCFKTRRGTRSQPWCGNHVRWHVWRGQYMPTPPQTYKTTLPSFFHM